MMLQPSNLKGLNRKRTRRTEYKTSGKQIQNAQKACRSIRIQNIWKVRKNKYEKPEKQYKTSGYPENCIPNVWKAKEKKTNTSR